MASLGQVNAAVQGSHFSHLESSSLEGRTVSISPGVMSTGTIIVGTLPLPACATAFVTSVSDIPYTIFDTVFAVAGDTISKS